MSICRDCPLGDLAITNCMPNSGRGAVLVVVPNPTAEQDLEGDIVSGVHGRLLSNLLCDAGFKAEDYTITSALRCGIPGDYQKTTESIESCRSHLRKTIHEIRPQKIIAFGDISLRALCRTSGLKTKRGTSLPLHPEFAWECEVYPTYSLSDIQRVPTYRRTVIADLRNANREDEADLVDFIFWETT